MWKDLAAPQIAKNYWRLEVYFFMNAMESNLDMECTSVIWVMHHIFSNIIADYFHFKFILHLYQQKNVIINAKS